MTETITLNDLLAMKNGERWQVMERAHPLDPEALVGMQYQGVDSALPPIANRILWKTFRKTFHRDEGGDTVRGWNVRMEQQGIDGPRVPMKDRKGRERSFGHYELRSAEGLRFPRSWVGAHYLDYGRQGNAFGANLGYCPLVAVNEGDMSLLLGWEVFKMGALFFPLPDYWALRLEGEIDTVEPRQKGAR